ncbi:MAG: radical SAM protein, partial [Bacteroidota bacterium]|nr:radical SAM protein [Bacteroidota bacterium]
RNPVAIITKNTVCLRDIDILSEMAKLDLVMVNFSITTLDLHLSRMLEPRTAAPYRKLEAIKKLAEAGIATGVMNAPIIPGLNDEETPKILEASANAGAISAGFTVVRLSYGNKDIFADWLKRNVPMEADKVLKRIMMVRDGKLSQSDFGKRMKGEGAYADYIKQQFGVYCRKYHLNERSVGLSTEHFTRPGTLFG